MSALATLLRKLGAEHGIEIEEDLSDIGLSDGGADEHEVDVDVDVTSLADTDLSGSAAGAVEIFLSDPRSWLASAPQQTDEGFWEPIIREGQWAMRPGASGQKRRSPLKVVAGHSKNQRKEIGLADIKSAFDDPAIEHVTVPTSHENDVTQNTGFIRKLKIVDGTYKPKGSKTEKKVKVLMGLYDIKLPDIKKKIELGAIASRSAGLLYDYVDTERGKTYPVVLEHVALTNKPWITGMKAFGRKLVKVAGSGAGAKSPAPVGLSLSDEEPSDEDLLAQDDVLGDNIALADANSITWDTSDDPDWLRGQVGCILNEARAKKMATIKANTPQGMYVNYEYPPCFRCVKATPGKALISDGYGDGANYWTAPISVVDGEVQLDDNYENWTPTKQAYISDDARKPGFDPGEEPLSEEERAARRATEPADLTPLQLAQQARRNKTSPAKGADKETTHPRGGEHMAGENGATLALSEEARKEIADLKAALDKERQEKVSLSEKVDRLIGQNVESSTDSYVAKLKADGFDEEHGFAGVLTVVRDLMLADDGGPAVQSESFSDDVNKDGVLSLSDAVKMIFGAFKRAEDGRVQLGQQVVAPSEVVGEEKDGKEGKPEGAKLSDGKPSGKETTAESEADFDSLSEEDQTIALIKDNPGLGAQMGLSLDANGKLVKASANGNSRAKAGE